MNIEQLPKSPNVLAGASNQSLARGLTILSVIAEQGGELGVRDIARRLSISSSIAHRLVRTLSDLGFLEQNAATQRYRVGLKAFEVGNSYLKFNNLDTLAAHELSYLANEHQLNGFLGTIQGHSAVYLMTVQSSGPITVRSAPGLHVPLHATGIAKAMLADFSDERILEILGPGPLEAVSPHTKTDPLEILKDIHEARRKGYAIADEEYVEGVLAVSAAIRDVSGMAIAAISGAVPRHLHQDKDTERIGKLLVDAAARISMALGAPQRR